MPTVIDRLNASLEGNALEAQIAQQVELLGELRTRVQGFTQPPRAVADVVAELGALPLPDLSALEQVSSRLAAVAAAVPPDPAALLTPMLERIEALGADLGGATTARLETALALAQRLHALTQIDVRCRQTSGGDSVGGTSGTTGDGTAPGGASSGPAGPSATQAVLDDANAALDGLPDPLDLRGLVVWVHERVGVDRDHPLLPAIIPVVDDLRDPIETLLAWESMTPAEIGEHMAGSIHEAAAYLSDMADGAIADVAADLAARAAEIPTGDLDAIARELHAALSAMADAASAADADAAGAAAADIDRLLDQYEPLRSTLLAGPLAGSSEAARRVRAAPDDLEETVAHAIGMLGAGGSPLALLPAAVAAPGVAELERWLAGIGEWLEAVAAAVDVSALVEPLQDAAQRAREVAEGLDDAVTALALAVRGACDAVAGRVDSIDVEEARVRLERAIDSVRDEVIARVDAALDPVLTALEGAVAALREAVGTFDPTGVTEPLEDAVERLIGVLGDGAVTEPLARVRASLETATRGLDGLSFAPITDRVIADIGTLTQALRAIDPNALPPPAVAALTGAVAALPNSLAPLTDPIVIDFGDLVERGPVAMLERARAQPARLLQHVRRFEPTVLVGDALDAPFDALLDEADRVRPSALLDPVRGAIDALDDTLRRGLVPGRLTAPIQAALDDARGAVSRLDPGALVEALEGPLREATAGVGQIVPAEAAFDAVASVPEALRRALDTADGAVGLARGLQRVLAALADGPQQLDAWIGSVLSRLEQIPDAGALDGPLEALGAAVDDLDRERVRRRLAAALTPMRAVCDAVRGSERLVALVSAHRAVPRATLEALPDGPERAAALAALDRFDPLDPLFGAPFEAIGAFASAIDQATADLEERLTSWQERYHEPGGVLDGLRRQAGTTVELRNWVEEVLGAQVVAPLRRLLDALAPLETMLDRMVGRFLEVLGALRATLDDLLRGPDALRAVREAFDAALERIAGLDLGFLDESLRPSVDGLLARLDALAPTALGDALEARLGDVLHALSADALLPHARVAALDHAYRDVIDDLRGLAPGRTLVDTAQRHWDDSVGPAIDALDVSPLLDAIIETLRELGGELRVELRRVDDAYRDMLAAVPPLGSSRGASVGFSP